jgi:hypothetical protein
MLRFSRPISSGAILIVVALAALAIIPSSPAMAQGQVGSVQLTPFVVGIIPVIGPGGGVGGVSIDADGAISRTERDESGRLRELRMRAMGEVPADVARESKMRKVSLARLEALIVRHIDEKKPLPDEVQNLAGLTRIEFVLAYPERGDIVLAGPAEGWKLDAGGIAVGRTSGKPVLQLDDLLQALRSAEPAIKTGTLCSIDPDGEGLKRLNKLLDQRGLVPSEALIETVEETLGPQHIRLEGVEPSSHFAQVMVAADYLMKRWAMGLEPAPVAGMPSYIEMLSKSSGRFPRNAMPRWWLAPRNEPLLHDADRLAWQLRGRGVEVLTEDGFLSKTGQVVDLGKSHPLGEKWAGTMTDKYEELSKHMPVLAELRNCIDLAMVATLLVKEDLPARASCPLTLLMDGERLQLCQYHVPRTVSSRASLTRRGRDWILSVSGGVDIDAWGALEDAEPSDALVKLRTDAAPTAKRDTPAVRADDNAHDAIAWWWD